jgi:hypothetical protein
MNTHEFIWTEKYRPQAVDECILPKSIKDILNGYRDQGRIPNLLLSGAPGCGKCLGYDTELELLVSDEVYQLLYEALDCGNP